MKPAQVGAESDLRVVEFLTNEQYVSTLQHLMRDGQQRASESSSAASAEQLTQDLVQTSTTRGFTVQYRRMRTKSAPSRLFSEASFLNSTFPATRLPEFDNDYGKDAKNMRRKKTQRKGCQQKKPKRSASSSTCQSEDADSDSGWWDEFWNSDSD